MFIASVHKSILGHKSERKFLVRADSLQEAEETFVQANKKLHEAGDIPLFHNSDKVTYEPTEFVDGIMEL
jgi:hypothetical protein